MHACSALPGSLAVGVAVHTFPVTTVVSGAQRISGHTGLPLYRLRQRSARCGSVICMAPEEEKMTRRSPLDFPIEWERPKPGRRPDIFPKFSPMKTPLPTPLPADPPDEDEEEEEEKKEEEEEDQEKDDPEKPQKET